MPIRISDIRTKVRGGLFRVTAEVNGRDLWFESGDTALEPSPEAFAGALLIPALTRGADLVVDQPLSAGWLANARSLMKIMREWWGFPIVGVRTAASAAYSERRPPGRALCFSCGVDSFYSLLRSADRIDSIVFVHGFDVPVEDTARMEMVERHFRAVAAETGKQGILVRTNLRVHPCMRRVSWNRAHGGALAAIGHLLADVGELVVAASVPIDYGHRWGSHYEIDHLWSSEKTRIVHHGAELWRREKLREIACEPVVRKHLRVCWRATGGDLNCSECEKCIRTMIALSGLGRLEDFPFSPSAPIPRLVASIRKVHPLLGRMYQAHLADGLAPEIEGEVRALIERTERGMFAFKLREWAHFLARRIALSAKRLLWR